MRVGQRLHGGGFVCAFCFQLNHGAFGGGQHHQAHDAFAVDAIAVFGDPDFALELGGGLGEFAGSACRPSLLMISISCLSMDVPKCNVRKSECFQTALAVFFAHQVLGGGCNGEKCPGWRLL